MPLGGIIRRLPMAPQKPVRAIRPIPPPEPPGIPPHVDFGMLFETFYVQHTNHPSRREERKRGIFHPSSALHYKTGNCIRSLIFELVFAPLSPGNIGSMLAKVMHNGSNRHVGIQDVFHKMADAGYMGVIDYKHEVRCVHPWLPLEGNTDGVVTVVSGHRYVHDYKTWSSSACAKTFEPEFKHKLQLNTYQGILGIRAGYIFYENKDNQKWIGPPHKFRSDFDPGLFAETESFCTDVLAAVKQKAMPAFEEKVCKDNLQFCYYKGICDAQRDGAVTWDDFDMREPAVKARHEECL